MALNRGDAAHFLRRVGYGGTEEEINFFTGMDNNAAVDYVIDAPVNPLPDPAFLTASFDQEWQRYQYATGWWIQRMADSTWHNRNASMSSPLVEKLTFFWHGHFTTSMRKVYDLPKIIEQNQVFRAGCLGDFETMAQQVSVGGAMLAYLDNATNIASAPQENFARELMELFTMGVGNYNEDDVIAMARAWTGHNTVGWVPALQEVVNDYIFVSSDHDYGQKTIFGMTQNWDGPETITEIVKGSKAVPTSRFITRKLFSHFVHANPSEAIIDQLAPVFVNNNSSIRELLRAILKHPNFWNAQGRRALVKPPVDMAAELIKRVGIPAQEQGFSWALNATAQTPFEPPNVSGWGENGYWLSATTAWGRQRIVDNIAWRVNQGNPNFLTDLVNLSGNAAATRLLDWFGIVEPSAATLANTIEWLDNAPNWALPHQAAVVAALAPEFHVA